MALAVLLIGGCRRGPPPDVTVITSERTPALALACPPGRCATTTVERGTCAGASDVVVVSGHSEPPSYLGSSAEALAKVIACARPKLIVLDTCWGASLPLFEALVARGVRARVIGASFFLPERGLVYDDAFWSQRDLPARVAAIHAEHASWPLTDLDLDAALVAHAKERAAAMTTAELKQNLRRTLPNYVALDEGSRAVVAVVPPERFR